MARKRKKIIKKQKSETKKVFIQKVNYKRLIPALLVLLIISASYVLIKNSSYFSIEEINIVDIDGASGVKVKDLTTLYKGRSIFDVDIKSISSSIREAYPFIKDAIVKKVLPDTIEIDIVSRIPVAKIKARVYFPIDKTGMVLSPEINSEDLPLINGLSMWLRPKAGMKIGDKKLKDALVLLESLDESSPLRTYKVTEIDARNSRNLIFYLKDGIEVRIGGKDYMERIKRLVKTLSNTKLDKENIKYIDVRFKDVVIGPK